MRSILIVVSIALIFMSLVVWLRQDNEEVIIANTEIIRLQNDIKNINLEIAHMLVVIDNAERYIREVQALKETLSKPIYVYLDPLDPPKKISVKVWP